MSVQIYDPVLTRGKGRVEIAGMFYPQGNGTPLFGSTAVAASASAIRAGASSASGWSVARTGTGLYVVTLSDTTITEIISAMATLGLAAAGDSYAQLGPIVMGTSGAKTTVSIQLVTGAAAADISANADARVSFSIKCRRSSVKG